MTDLTIPTRHLDLGCGDSPRNPLNQSHLYGCDLLDISSFEKTTHFEYKQADVIRETIPYPNNYFSSVSAFDFLEHVPRHSVDKNGKPVSPFISLMSEIHRILIPGGLLIASTPAYPHPQAFQDPTHVNIITAKTHEYFCGAEPYAVRYGFVGRFSVQRVAFEVPKNIHGQRTSFLKNTLRNFHRRLFKGGLSHLTWELIAEK